jgi:hypothetical protein
MRDLWCLNIIIFLFLNDVIVFLNLIYVNPVPVDPLCVYITINSCIDHDWLFLVDINYFRLFLWLNNYWFWWDYNLWDDQHFWDLDLPVRINNTLQTQDVKLERCHFILYQIEAHLGEVSQPKYFKLQKVLELLVNAEVDEFLAGVVEYNKPYTKASLLQVVYHKHGHNLHLSCLFIVSSFPCVEHAIDLVVLGLSDFKDTSSDCSCDYESCPLF